METMKVPVNPPFPELRGSIDSIKYPAFVETKLDGEFCYVHLVKNGSFTINKYGRVRKDFPFIQTLERLSKRKGFTSATLLAELYATDGKQGDLYNLLKMKKDNSLKLYLFDVIELNGTDLRNEQLIDRKEIISLNFQNHSDGILRPWIASDRKEVDQRFKHVISSGYEGVVVKSIESQLSLGPCTWVKMKFKDQNDYNVYHVDITQEKISVLVPGPVVTTSPGQISRLTHSIVGVKCPTRYKKFIKKGDLVTIEHQGVLKSGSLRHPVLIPKKEWK